MAKKGRVTAHLRLTTQAAAALRAVWSESVSVNGAIDAPSFRAKHAAWLDTLDQLRARQLLARDGEHYRLTPLGLASIDDARARQVLQLGDVVHDALIGRYTNAKTRSQPLCVSDLATQLDVERSALDFALLHLEEALSLWIASRSIDLRAPDAYLIASENVIRYQSISEVVAQLCQWQASYRQDISPRNYVGTSRPRQRIAQRDAALLGALPRPLQQLLTEIYNAIDNGAGFLPAMGLRTLIDAVANDTVRDIGGFNQKIAAMKVEGSITPAQVNQITAAIEIGHAAVHRRHRPTAKTIRAVLMIVEHLLRQKYLLDPLAVQIAGVAPPRQVTRRKLNDTSK